MSSPILEHSELEQHLPARAVFPEAMPRYPNLWFLIDDRLALRGRYRYAVELVVKLLERDLSMRDDFVSGIENEFAYHLLAQPGERADFQMRTPVAHYYEHPEDASLSHMHQAHARFYVSALEQGGRYAVSLPSLSDRRHLLVPASIHYEVATEDPAHPYVDSCPHCGMTGEYEMEIDKSTEDYCIKIHDPLGVELILHGTVRGHIPEPEGAGPQRFLDGLSGSYGSVRPWRIAASSFVPSGLEPERLGIALVQPVQRERRRARRRSWR